MRISIRGTVQGVGFRPAVFRAAVAVGANGTVRNDGSVVTVETDRNMLDEIMRNLPPLAVIESVSMDDIPYKGPKGFKVIESSEGTGGVSIPADTAVCNRCLGDMSEGRRKGYPFTTCTDCGARFTLMMSLPYDRNKTSLDEFPMCQACKDEYVEPKDRRFHHQTVCCPECGPRYLLSDHNGKTLPGDPIAGFASRLSDGKFGIAKSWGGMHICSVPERIPELREWYGRKQKPFAIMVRDADAVRRYAVPTEDEMRQLSSPGRPIVLLEKIHNEITEAASPGLDNIGIFLPHTGMQHLLFQAYGGDALVMTSANMPGEPMILDDSDVMSLGADMYLLHNQKIINRADDTVLRMYGNRTFYIRKSRGSTPSYLDVGSGGSVVGIGAQENLTAAVALGGRMHFTQHIGNGESYGVTDYLEKATDSLIGMTGCIPEVVAMDLHPGYANRAYGRRLVERYGADLLEVQHHWAHGASLLAENKVERAAVIAIDGTGYGDDGNAWGGEVLLCDAEGYDRVAHLQNIPLLGGEKAVRDIRRLKFAVDRLNGERSSFVSDEEDAVLGKMMNKSVGTSSLGRLLDTLAYSLSICSIRSYDGEPAMKMEPLLNRGKLIPGFETEVSNGEIKTAHMFKGISERTDRANVAYSIIYATAKALAETACFAAESEGLEYVGVTGGVSYSRPICDIFKNVVSGRGLKLMTHDKVPNGDGGISAGQAAIALRRLS
jgi:hydrogenase maturation protein HypF